MTIFAATTRRHLSLAAHMRYAAPAAQVPDDVKATMDKSAAGKEVEAAWNASLAAYKGKYPKEAAEFEGLLSGKLPDGWDKALPTYKPGESLGRSGGGGAEGSKGHSSL